MHITRYGHASEKVVDSGGSLACLELLEEDGTLEHVSRDR